MLTFREVLLADRRDWFHTDTFVENGIRWRDNTRAEIRDLVVEMLDRVDGRAVYTDEDERLQSAYRGLLLANRTPLTYGTFSRVGRDFLRDHSALLEP